MPKGTPTKTLAEVLQPGSSGYGLGMFSQQEIVAIRLFEKNGKPYIRCLATDKDRPAKPEEIVRQLYLRRLMEEYGYQRERIFLEKGVQFGSSIAEKRADIFVSQVDDPDTAYIIVEVKKSRRRDGLEQLKSYCNAEGSPIGVWTNGDEAVYLHREEPNLFKSLSDVPRSDQKLSDLLAERWDLERLTRENRLVQERLTLKSIILDHCCPGQEFSISAKAQHSE